MKVKVESEKVGLKLNIHKTKIMVSGPITSWQIDGKTMETLTVFIFLGSKITADSDCSHEIKRCFLLGRKAMTNLDSILKSRDIVNKDPYKSKLWFFQQPGDQPEGMNSVGRKWCSLWLEVRDYMFISSIRFSFVLFQKHQFFGTQLSLWSNSHIHTWLLEKP